jgi:hypothetical protein
LKEYTNDIGYEVMSSVRVNGTLREQHRQDANATCLHAGANPEYVHAPSQLKSSSSIRHDHAIKGVAKPVGVVYTL